METWQDLLERNRRWAAEIESSNPGYFRRVAGVHAPRAMFVGCSDARVPANLLTRAEPGEIFVHRNIANQVLPTDASLSAGLRYAIDVLGVDELIVCGHRGCGGVRASLGAHGPDDLEPWIASLRRLARARRDELDALPDDARVERLVELNVEEQVEALASHPLVCAAWRRGRDLRVHGWIYDLECGLVRPQRVVGRDGVEIPVAAGEAARAAG